MRRWLPLWFESWVTFDFGNRDRSWTIIATVIIVLALTAIMFAFVYIKMKKVGISFDQL